MPDAPLPPDVRRFITGVVRSVNELELLLLLAEERDEPWTAAAASRVLYQSEGWVAGHLEALVVLGLAEQVGDGPPGYRFGPGDAATRRTIQQTGECFRRRRAAVIALIYRGEPSSAERFADAFRLRRDDEDEEG